MTRGFVDLQVNGWMGLSFSTPGLTVADVRKVTLALLARGTVAYCPTIITGPYEMYRENLAVVAKAMQDSELGSHILGVHMEGPFISPEPGAVGAHSPQYVRPPSPQDFDKFQEWAEGHIVLITVAPERPGAAVFIRHAVSRGVVVSVGHHLASDEDLAAAVAAGATACTHVANGLPNQIHRHQNPIWWQLACDSLWGMFITDGHHLPAPLIKVALRSKTVERFVVTSDASPLAGMPPGKYDAFGLGVTVSESGRIASAETGGLAGSHSTMLECMNHLASLDLLTEAELLQVGFANPLKMLGRDANSLNRVPAPNVVFKEGRFVVNPA